MALMAVFAPWIAPYDPTQIDMLNRLQPPSLSHWMGTDLTGRDVFSRLIWGARPSLQVGILAVLIGLPGGFAVGLLAGFYRGTILEAILMRIVEIIAAVPLLIVAIAVVGVLGVKPMPLGPFMITNEVKIIVVLGFLYIPGLARVVFAVAASEATSDYIRARRIQGVGDFTLMVSDILPNCLSVVIVWGTLLTAGGVLAEAGLSFVGLGVQPPDASWGVMLSDARKFIFSGEWWLLLFPGLAISLTVIGLNLLGDALRDILDPRQYTGPRLD
jgi:peptide/nickel transport system permease protein